MPPLALALPHHEALETLPFGTVLEPRDVGRDTEVAQVDMAAFRAGVAVHRGRADRVGEVPGHFFDEDALTLTGRTLLFRLMKTRGTG